MELTYADPLFFYWYRVCRHCKIISRKLLQHLAKASYDRLDDKASASSYPQIAALTELFELRRPIRSYLTPLQVILTSNNVTSSISHPHLTWTNQEAKVLNSTVSRGVNFTDPARCSQNLDRQRLDLARCSV